MQAAHIGGCALRIICAAGLGVGRVLRFAVAPWIDSYLSNPGYLALGCGR
jgi:hypothetical protein